MKFEESALVPWSIIRGYFLLNNASLIINLSYITTFQCLLRQYFENILRCTEFDIFHDFIHTGCFYDCSIIVQDPKYHIVIKLSNLCFLMGNHLLNKFCETQFCKSSFCGKQLFMTNNLSSLKTKLYMLPHCPIISTTVIHFFQKNILYIRIYFHSSLRKVWPIDI